MKDYIIENQDFIGSKEMARIAIQTNQHTKDISKIKLKMATKDDLKKVMDNFITPDTYKHFLIINGKNRSRYRLQKNIKILFSDFKIY